jgi:hypothetical protein
MHERSDKACTTAMPGRVVQFSGQPPAPMRGVLARRRRHRRRRRCRLCLAVGLKTVASASGEAKKRVALSVRGGCRCSSRLAREALDGEQQRSQLRGAARHRRARAAVRVVRVGVLSASEPASGPAGIVVVVTAAAASATSDKQARSSQPVPCPPWLLWKHAPHACV